MYLDYDDALESQRYSWKPIGGAALELAKSRAWQAIDSALVYRAASRLPNVDKADYRAMQARYRREFRYWRDAVRDLRVQGLGDGGAGMD